MIYLADVIPFSEIFKELALIQLKNEYTRRLYKG